jgi:tetratricopeptide (TPR) repeat protein
MVARTGRRSGVLGTMDGLDYFRQLEEATGMSPWEASRGSGRLVIGYDDARRVMIMHDPSFGPAWEVGYDDFDKMWAAIKREYLLAYPHDYANFVVKHASASPYPAPTSDQQAAFLYVQGYALASVGRLAEAEQQFHDGLAVRGIGIGYQHLFLFELAQIYRTQGKTEIAIATAEKAAALLPEHHRPWELLAELYGTITGRQQKADDARRKAEAACSNPQAARAVARALARDFNVFACEPGKLLAADTPVLDRVFDNPSFGWSVSYPADWKIDKTNPRDVRISTPEGNVLCGIHSNAVRFQTMDEFAESAQAFNEKYFRDRGTTVRSSPKERLSLPNGVIGIDVVNDILSGGRSRRIYVLAKPIGYMIDCETYAANWAKFEPFFAEIIASFSLSENPLGRDRGKR